MMVKPPVGNRQSAIRNLPFAIFAILALLLRLAPLGRYVTPDEPAWVHRAILFGDALAGRTGASFPVTGHPGVTTMWLGAAGVAVQRLLSPQASAAHLDWIRNLAWLAPENAPAFGYLATFLPAGRIAVALATSLGLLAAGLLAARAFDRHTALLLMGLLAFEPFLAGHSGLLHTDALLATFILLALLAAWNGLRAPSPFLWWTLAGFCAGLAVLTKTPGIIAVLLVGGILVVRVAYCRFQVPSCDSGVANPNAIRNLPLAIRNSQIAPFLITLVLTLFALYPALWSDPLGVVQTLGGFAGRHVESVQRPIFFLGEWTYNPGLAFYPLAWLFRASPVVLVGLGLGLARLRRLPADRRIAFLTLLAFSLLYGAAMSLGVKKHDRYLLPIFPSLALAAAIAFAPLAPRPSPLASRLSLLTPLALQLFVLLPFLTCPLGYANPLLGGPPVAARVLTLDWGEGAGAAARWLNRLDGAADLVVAAADVPSFASVFAGRTVSLEQADLADYRVESTAPPGAEIAHAVRLGLVDRTLILTETVWLEQADFLAQRAGPDDLILVDANTPLLRRYDGPGVLRSAAGLPDEPSIADWLAEQAAGRTTIWLVASPDASPITAAQLRRQLEAIADPILAADSITSFAARSPLTTAAPVPYQAAFGGQLALVDAALPQAVAWPDSLAATLRWRILTALPTDNLAMLSLWDEAGNQWANVERPVLNGVDFPTSAWAAGEWADARYALSFPPGVPPGEYSVEASLYDGSGAALGAVAADGAFRGLRLPFGTVQVDPPVSPPSHADLEIFHPLDAYLAELVLLGTGSIPAEVLSGDHMALALFWEASAAPSVDYRASLALVSGDGERVVETSVSLSPYPTSRWRAGDRFESRYRFHVLPDVPPASYGLTLQILDPASAQVGEVALGSVTVLPRERSFALPDILHPLDLTWGEFARLRGYDLAAPEALPGGSLSLTLIWQAEGPADQDYTLFVHLIDSDGQLRGQVDQFNYAAPPSTWAAGQVIIDRVDLPVAADAPPGECTIAFGFYDAAHGDRPLVRDAEGTPLGDSFVLPLEVTVTGGVP